MYASRLSRPMRLPPRPPILAAELVATDQGVALGHADVEFLGDLRAGQEAGGHVLTVERLARGRVSGRIAAAPDGRGVR